MTTHEHRDAKKRTLRCPACGSRVETQTVVQNSGVREILCATPEELTQCEHCPEMLEYGGRPGALTLQRARPERVQAFRELERERPNHIELPALLEYVSRYRTMPTQTADRTPGTIRLAFSFQGSRPER
jgi:hypothetical protein